MTLDGYPSSRHDDTMKTSTVLLALPALSLAVVPPSSHLPPDPSLARASLARRGEGADGEALTPKLAVTPLLPPSGGGLDNGDAATAVHDEERIVLSSVAVGIVTAALGHAYGKVLDATVGLVWGALPRALGGVISGKTGPALFVTAVCTVGGLVMGILSSVFDEAFTVADFVSALSKAPAEALPSSR